MTKLESRRKIAFESFVYFYKQARYWHQKSCDAVASGFVTAAENMFDKGHTCFLRAKKENQKLREIEEQIEAASRLQN